MSDEAWNTVNPRLEKRRPPEEVAKWLKKEYPCYAMPSKTIYSYILFHMKGEGTCENTSYLIRDMLYLVTDFRELAQWDVSKIAGLLNERPRKTLGFKTPYEVFSELR
jgi:IS30 family transposase